MTLLRRPAHASSARRLVRLVACAALVVPVAACSSDDGDGTGATDPTPTTSSPTEAGPTEVDRDLGPEGSACSRLDLEAIESATGIAVGDVQHDGEAEGSETCSFFALEDELVAVVDITPDDVEIREGLPLVTVDATEPESIEVAGTEALVVTSSRQGTAHTGLVAKEGKRLMRVNVDSPARVESDARELALLVAEMVVSAG